MFASRRSGSFYLESEDGPVVKFDNDINFMAITISPVKEFKPGITPG